MNLLLFRYCVFAFVASTVIGTLEVSASTTYLPTPCTSYATSGVRPTPTTGQIVISKEQIVFDLCRAAFVISTEKDTGNPRTLYRLRTIATEGRLVTACVTQRPRPPGNPETATNYIMQHEFGCGPYDNVKTASPKQVKWTDVCSTMIQNARPIPGRGMHGPITADVAYDACYLANTISNTDTVDPEGRLSSDVIRLLDKLENEFELANRIQGGVAPSQSDTDYAIERQYGCGTYPCPYPSPKPKPTLTPKPTAMPSS